MPILEILHFPDPRLRKKAMPVAQVDDQVRQTVDAMFETMYQAPGIGLAATQVNIHKRIIVIDISESKTQPLCLINPEIIELSGEAEMEEGCLSVPGFYEPVRRAEQVKVVSLGRNGDRFELDAHNLLAVCIQHEIDHLEGKLFIDYVSPLKRQRIRKKLDKQKKSGMINSKPTRQII